MNKIFKIKLKEHEQEVNFINTIKTKIQVNFLLNLIKGRS